jgi:hypothetical protein
VAGQFGLGGAQQPDLGHDLGGEILEGDGGVIGVELDRGAGRGQPLLGAGDTLLAVGGGGEHLDQAGPAGGEQHVGAGVALEHGQVGLAQVAGERGGGQQLTDQVVDALGVLRAGLGEPVGGAHAPVQRGALGVGQLQRAQPGRVDQRQAGEGVGVDAVGLGVPGQNRRRSAALAELTR